MIGIRKTTEAQIETLAKDQTLWPTASNQKPQIALENLTFRQTKLLMLDN